MATSFRVGVGYDIHRLAEGRRLLREMVNADQLGDVDPIEEAFAEMLRTLEGNR